MGPVASIIQRHLATDGLHLPPTYMGAAIVVRKVDYSFQELSNWRDLVVDSLLSTNGVMMDDLDEVQNRVAIGYDRRITGAPAAIMTRVTQMGIPVAAVVLVPMDPIHPNVAARRRTRRAGFNHDTTLTSFADTVAGGIELGTTAGRCTTSLVVDRVSNGDHGFVTASHCTTHMYELDYDTFYQPYSGTNTQALGTEEEDPAPTTCSFFQDCTDARAADAVYATLSTGTLGGRRGAIARTTNRDTSHTSGTTISSSNPWINVSGGESSLVVGLTLDKVGMMSGWTYGTMNGTCVDIDEVQGGKTHRVWCTGRADYTAVDGDSGAPVFLWDGADGATYYGDHIAADPSCCHRYFSPLGQITSDLGSLTIVSPITVSTPSLSGSVDGSGHAALSWSASSTTNTNVTTTYQIYRETWNAATGYCVILDNGEDGTSTGTSWTDTSPLLSAGSYNGTTPVDGNSYNWTMYWIVAYNSGISAQSNYIWYQGDYNGTGQCNGN